jgi:tetratricopeptide (TPR) repeat protein/transglutaminase-like putative cysteine protease
MRFRISLAAVLFAISVAPSLAQQPKPPASQDYSKEAYVIERYSARILAETDGSGSRELTAEVKVLADAGVKAFAVLDFTYTSANEVVDIDYVRVRKPDGTVVKTPDYNIQDMPGEVTRTAPLYSDIHEKHVAVKGLAVGDVLEYLVRFRVVKPEVPGQFWYEHSFITDGIVKDERLEISFPAGKYVKVVSPEFKPEIKDEGGRRVYRWTHANLEVKEKDPRQAPRRIPPTPSVQVTTFASWEDVGRWYGELQKAPLEVTPAIQAKAAELTKGLKTDDEKFRAIYNFVALQFHYIGLDFGIGRYQPHAADDVLGNGYGDCKDKHTLIASLLKAAGYDAWPALIHTNRKLDPDVPSPAQFNHVITVIPSGGSYIWLDTTPEVSPYRLLLTLLRDKDALVIPSNKAPMLMKTPAESPFAQRQEFTVEGELGADGTYTGHIEQNFRGDTEVLLRMMFRQVSQSQWKEAMQGFSSRLGFGGEVSNVKVSPPDKTDEPLHISYDYVRKNYSDWENKQFGPPLPPMGMEVGKDQPKPLEPVLIGALGEVVYHSKFKLPPGYSIVPPKGMDLVEPYAEYHTTAALQDGALITSRRLVVKWSEVPLEKWENLKDFGKAVSDDEYKFITLNGLNAGTSGSSSSVAGLDQKFRDASQAVQSGDRIRAQELFQQVIAADPKYPMAHMNLGYILMTQHKPTEALAEWHKEQEANPNDIRAYQMPAQYLTYMGRKDDAILEWRKVLKADPKNHEAALTVSALLTEAGKNKEAADVLESAIGASPDSQTLKAALAMAYLKSGQSEKALPYVHAAADNSSDVMTLNNLAYELADSKMHLDLAKEYGEKSLHELERRSINDVAADDTGAKVTYQFSMIWDTLGWIYFQMGDSARAQSFVRASWLIAQDGIVGEHLGEIYEKLGRTTEAAHVYELALAAVGTPPVNYSIQPPLSGDPSQALTTELTARYQKLTGKKPDLRTTWRLPNGEWTKTASEQLSQMRTSKFGKIPTASGSAEFTIVFVPGRVESVKYVRGEESLKDLTDKIKAAHYQVEFPAGSQAKLLRRAELSCFPASGCMVVLIPTSKVAQVTGQ